MVFPSFFNLSLNFLNKEFIIGTQQVIINLTRSRVINDFLRWDHRLSPSRGTEPRTLHLGWSCLELPRAHPFLGFPLPQGLALWAKTPMWRSSSFTMNSFTPHASFCPGCGGGFLVEGRVLVAGIGRGWRRGCAGKTRVESHEVSDLRDPEDSGSRPPQWDSSPGDTVPSDPCSGWPAGGLLQTPLGGLCSLWSLSAALETQVACECVRAGGMEDTVAERGVF